MAESHNEIQKRYYQRNREKINAKRREYYDKNKEKLMARGRLRAAESYRRRKQEKYAYEKSYKLAGLINKLRLIPNMDYWEWA